MVATYFRTSSSTPKPFADRKIRKLRAFAETLASSRQATLQHFQDFATGLDTGSREELGNLRSLVERGEITDVVTTDLSRLSSRPSELRALFELMSLRGVNLWVLDKSSLKPYSSSKL